MKNRVKAKNMVRSNRIVFFYFLTQTAKIGSYLTILLQKNVFCDQKRNFLFHEFLKYIKASFVVLLTILSYVMKSRKEQHFVNYCKFKKPNYS